MIKEGNVECTQEPDWFVATPSPYEQPPDFRCVPGYWDVPLPSRSSWINLSRKSTNLTLDNPRSLALGSTEKVDLLGCNVRRFLLAKNSTQGTCPSYIWPSYVAIALGLTFLPLTARGEPWVEQPVLESMWMGLPYSVIGPTHNVLYDPAIWKRRIFHRRIVRLGWCYWGLDPGRYHKVYAA